MASPNGKNGRTAREIVESETDSGDDDFDGFSSGSDIDIGSDLSDLDTSGTESDGDEIVNDEWTSRFSRIRVGITLAFYFLTLFKYKYMCFGGQ